MMRGLVKATRGPLAGVALLACVGLITAGGLWRMASQEASAAPWKKVRIIAIYGDRMIGVDALGYYRVRIDPDGTQPVEYHWDFGDGGKAGGVLVSHRFAEAGRYAVRVTARNLYGTDTDSILVTVIPALEVTVRPPSAWERVTEAANDVAGAAPAPTTRPPPTERTARPAAPSRASKLPASLDIENGLAWPKSGYTWVVATHLHREAAEATMRQYRGDGYRVRIMVDNSGSGSTAYRVVVGHFATVKAALQVKDLLPSERPGGIWLLALSGPPQAK